MSIKRNASAVWQGNLKDGAGNLSTDSGILSETPYSFSTRFENKSGTNPEELIAAAHAGCFSMAFSAELLKAGFPPDSIHTQATVTLEKVPSDFTITEVHLAVDAQVPKITDSEFMKIAEAAKLGCPVSKLLKAKITLDAKLMSEEKARVAS